MGVEDKIDVLVSEISKLIDKKVSDAIDKLNRDPYDSGCYDGSYNEEINLSVAIKNILSSFRIEVK